MNHCDSAAVTELLRTEDFTLVIPTFNRPDHLARILKYCIPRFAKIQILDSSTDAVVAVNKKLINGLERKVEYYVFDNKIRSIEKVIAGLEKVTTPYFAFCADDDVLFPAGVLAALGVLRQNPDIVGVDGIYLSFRVEPSSINVGIEYSNSGIVAEHPLARVFRFLERYESLFYGVFRIAQLLPIFRYVLHLHSYHYSELFQSVSVLLIGKTMRLPVFYAGRQQCEPAEIGREKWQTYFWFAENRVEFLEHYVSYRTQLLNFYKSHTMPPHLPDEDFIRGMDLAHATFFSVNCPASYFFEQLGNFGPGDLYAVSDGVGVLASFKGVYRLRLERMVTRLARMIEQGVKAVTFPWHLVLLNRSVVSQFGSSYKCVLATQRIAWITGVPEFHRAFIELCIYMRSHETNRR